MMITKRKKYELKFKQNEFSQRLCSNFSVSINFWECCSELSACVVQIDITTRGTASSSFDVCFLLFIDVFLIFVQGFTKE